MTFNLHTHTARCGHATGAEEEYVESAIGAGLKLLGFSDHTPYNFPDGFVSKIRMSMEQLEEYAQTIRQLQRQYADKIQIRLGLEAEYFPDLFRDLQTHMADCGIEYILMGQHHLDNGVNTTWVALPTEDETFLEKYCNQVMDGFQTGAFTYLAHPDLFNYQGPDAIYARHMRRLCREAKACGIPLEINLLGLGLEKHYPNERFWAVVGEEGCDVVLGCDAHDPLRLNMPQWEERAMELVKTYDLKLVDSVPLRRPY